MEQNIELDNIVETKSSDLLEILNDNSDSLKIIDDDEVKLRTLLNFANKFAENQKNIDSEIVDLVNDNFWDLV